MDFRSNDFGGEGESSSSVTAKKSWFWLGGRAGGASTVLAVYQNISLTPRKKGSVGVTPLLGTALEQCNMADDGTVVWAGVDEHGVTHVTTVTTPGSYVLTNAQWVLHNRVLYSSFPTTAAVSTSNPTSTPTPTSSLNMTFGNVSGSWSRINAAGGNSTITRAIFSLDAMHDGGDNSDTESSGDGGVDYAYGITTGVESVQQAYTVFDNLNTIQRTLGGEKDDGAATAVMADANTVLGTFWTAGEGWLEESI